MTILKLVVVTQTFFKLRKSLWKRYLLRFFNRLIHSVAEGQMVIIYHFRLLSPLQFYVGVWNIYLKVPISTFGYKTIFSGAPFMTLIRNSMELSS